MQEIPSKIHVVWSRKRDGGEWNPLYVEEMPRGMLLMKEDYEYRHCAYERVPVPEAHRYRGADGNLSGTSD